MPVERVRLRAKARRDIDGIWSYTAETWGPVAANDYVRGLQATLDVIGASPRIARERAAIDPPVRVHPYHSHLVIYRIADDGIDVVRVFHSRRNWMAEMGS